MITLPHILFASADRRRRWGGPARRARDVQHGWERESRAAAGPVVDPSAPWRPYVPARDEFRLADAPVAASVTVTAILGDEPFRGRLLSLGIVPGASALITSGGRGHPIVLALGGGRLAIDVASSNLVVVRDQQAAGDDGRAI